VLALLAEETQLGWQLGVLSVLPAKVTEAMAHLQAERNRQTQEATSQTEQRGIRGEPK
jgi:hypothetical protein